MTWWSSVKPQAKTAAACVCPIAFVAAGSNKKPPPSKQQHGISSNSILAGADDWSFGFDLPGSNYAFPPHIASTNQRPDIFAYSNKLNRCILAELTSPMEDRCLTSTMLKSSKYAPLRAGIIEAGWTCELYTFEVGARGYVSSGLREFLNALGVPPKAKNNTYDACGKVALRCSYTIYLQHRNTRWPHLTPIVQSV